MAVIWYAPAAKVNWLELKSRTRLCGSLSIVLRSRVVHVAATPAPPLVPDGLLSVRTAIFRVKESTSLRSLLTSAVLVWES